MRTVLTTIMLRPPLKITELQLALAQVLELELDWDQQIAERMELTMMMLPQVCVAD